MIEFIKLARKRGVVADLIHAAFNVAFAAATIFLTIVFDTPWPAVLLVILSKWRVVAVRPRYWWANFLSSLPDLTFGIGLVIISWGCGLLGQEYLTLGQVTPIPAIAVQVIIGIIYAIWLIAIKPQHSETMVGFQALASQFVGLTAVFFISHSLPLVLAMLLTMVVAFASARQALGIFEEKDQDLLSTVWGLLVMELAFVSWHWSVSYQLTPLIRVPQIAIITAAISFTAFRVYKAWHDDRRVTWDELGYPVAFTVAITCLVLFAFSGLY
ncbi:MAG: hypothetical protein Q4C83_00500 [Candidatus Saccharibacteria bacterium]|nr:hypothetical protein [Candidatus Saccharibacteria bacterium]